MFLKKGEKGLTFWSPGKVAVIQTKSPEFETASHYTDIVDPRHTDLQRNTIKAFKNHSRTGWSGKKLEDSANRIAPSCWLQAVPTHTFASCGWWRVCLRSFASCGYYPWKYLQKNQTLPIFRPKNRTRTIRRSPQPKMALPLQTPATTQKPRHLALSRMMTS